jgi:GAF domain-containing protein
MSGTALEDAVVEAIFSSREALAVTRARCYVLEPSGSFRLAASSGFASDLSPDEVLEPGHPLIQWVRRHHKPAYANSPHEAGPLAPMMEREQYARSLSVPIYQGSLLVGILELQARAGNAPFGPDDARGIERVAGRISAILGQPDGATVAQAVPTAGEDREALFLASQPRTTDFPPPPDLFSGREETPRLDPHLAAAASAAGAPVEVPAPEPRPEVTRREALLFKGFANALLLNPEVEAAIFSLWTQERVELYVGTRRPFSPPGREILMRELESALLSAVPGISVPSERLFNTEFPLGRGPGEIREPGAIQSSVIFSGRSTLLLTIVFSRPPVFTSEGALKETHRLVRAAVLQVRGAERYRITYRSLVHFLIEPDRRSYPQLKAHSYAVGSLCRRFASALRLPAETVEQFAVAGLLHDIGLKSLDIPYEQINGRRPLDLEQLGFVRKHPEVGATLLSRVEFPYPIAPLVRHHHERFDGAGYPDRLVGERIPLGARVIGIAEAYDAMVSPHSYRAAISRDAALEIILQKGGSQFDPRLARQFAGLVRSGSPAGEESQPIEP